MVAAHENNGVTSEPFFYCYRLFFFFENLPLHYILRHSPLTHIVLQYEYVTRGVGGEGGDEKTKNRPPAARTNVLVARIGRGTRVRDRGTRDAPRRRRRASLVRGHGQASTKKDGCGRTCSTGCDTRAARRRQQAPYACGVHS